MKESKLWKEIMKYFKHLIVPSASNLKLLEKFLGYKDKKYDDLEGRKLKKFETKMVGGLPFIIYVYE